MARGRVRRTHLFAACAVCLSAAGVGGCMMAPGSLRAAKVEVAPIEMSLDGAAPTLAAAVAASGEKSEQLAPALKERLIIYNATLELAVDRIGYSIEQAKTLAAQAGGYVQELTTSSATLRVPATKFHETLGALLKLGRVVRKQVKGTDVTEEARDLHIRLDNAEKIRQRLVALLEKSQKVEETLKVEQELGRVTETIELLKGKIRHLEHNVAFSTITVHFTSSLPQDQFDVTIPFEWVNELGGELVRGDTGRPHDARSPWRLVAIRLPESYVKYYEWGYVTKAMSADGVVVQVRRLANYRGGTTDFWHGLARRALVQEKHFTLGEEKAVGLRGGYAARLLVLSKDIGDQKQGYLVAVAATKDHVYVFEAWGPQEKLTKERTVLEAALATLRLGWCRQFLWHLF